jgi:hypothetical protein
MMTAHALRTAVDRDVREGPSPKPTRRPGPTFGDILVSKATARSDFYTISVVPNSSELSADHYDDAVKMARAFAHERGVDEWFTVDHTHFVRLGKRPQVDDATIDEILADSFPASDPPPWTLGMEQ